MVVCVSKCPRVPTESSQVSGVSSTWRKTLSGTSLLGSLSVVQSKTQDCTWFPNGMCLAACFSLFLFLFQVIAKMQGTAKGNMNSQFC